MSVTSPIFIFLFLPITLAIYSFIPQNAKKYALVAISALVYIIANIKNPFSVILLALTVISVYFLARLIEKQRGKTRVTVTAASVTVIAAVFVTLRLADPLGINVLGVEYPFGSSIWLLAAISCLIDVKREDAPPPSIVDAALYISYFPVMVAGPFVKYRESVGLFDRAEVNFDGIAKGAEYFMLGFIKRYAVAAVLGEMLSLMWNNADVGIGIVSLLEYTVIVPFAVYAFFSGYSDMGTGISLMYGVRLPDNFDRPITAISPIDYMRRFMSTICGFANDYIAYAIIGRKNDGFRRFAAYFAVFEFLIFWFSSDPTATIVLLPFAAIIAFFAAVLKERVRPLAARIVSGVIVFVCSAFFWGIMLAPNIFSAFGSALSAFADFSNSTSLLLLSGISLQKYLITLVTAVIAVFLLDRAVRVPEITVPTKKDTVIKVAVNILMLLMFAITVFLYYPQFPQ